MKLWECVWENVFECLRICISQYYEIVRVCVWENVFACLRICISQYYEIVRMCDNIIKIKGLNLKL